MTDENKTSDEAKTPSRSDERILELNDLSKALASTEKWKEKAEHRDQIVKDLKTQITELTVSNQKKSGEFEKLYSAEASDHKALKTHFQVLEQTNVELQNQVENFKSEAIMKQFMDHALKSVKDKTLGRRALIGLHAEGLVDLTPPEGIESAAELATALLQQDHPSLFVSDDRRAGTIAGNIPGARIERNGKSNKVGKFTLLPTRK